MITVKPSPLSPSEVLKLRDWLKLPEAELLREVIVSRIADYQVQAGNLLIVSLKQNDQSLYSAEEAARKAVPYINALEVISEILSTDATNVQRIGLDVDEPIVSTL